MISNKCYYALRALIELSREYGKGPVSICSIAKKQEIPPRFLEAILRQLKQAGYAESVRGKEGGYLLVKKPENILLGEVLRLFEGPLVPNNPGVSLTPPHKDVFKTIWKRAEVALSEIYDNTNFAELLKEDLQLNTNHIMDYSIWQK